MLIQNNPLLLQLNVAEPFDKVGEVPFGLDVLSNAKFLDLFSNRGFTLFGFLILHFSFLSLGHFGLWEERASNFLLYEYIPSCVYPVTFR